MGGYTLATFIGLLILIVLSSVAVIHNKYQSRHLFIEIKKQERLLEQFDVEWGQMQLELTTLADQNRVEQIARKNLHLTLPLRDKTIYIKP